MNRWTATDSSNVIVVRIIDGTKNEGGVTLLFTYLPIYCMVPFPPLIQTIMIMGGGVEI